MHIILKLRIFICKYFVIGKLFSIYTNKELFLFFNTNKLLCLTRIMIYKIYFK